jgi:hypothetical protein
MTLSDRLAEAAQQRAGVRTVAPGSLLAEPRRADRELTVILGAHIPVATVEPDPEAERDSVCPSCGRTGELGILDLGRQTTDWSCLACGTLWRVAMPASVAHHLR